MERPAFDGDLFDALRRGDRAALSRAITMVESTRPTDRAIAVELVERALPFSGNGLRVGITGIPGVGKSTLIDALGREAIRKGHRVAVLATDPSSARSGGSILGDKTRMEELARSEMAFIRPTASGGFLGGVARRTRETIILCEAAGYDLVLIETVGVGQSELDVDGMTDLNVLLMIPGAGDELQGIKRGIMESADAIVLTKAHGPGHEQHGLARSALLNAIVFLPTRESGRRPDVLMTDALSGLGVAALLDHLEGLHEADRTSGYLSHRRQQQNVQWLHHALREGLIARLMDDPRTAEELSMLEERVRSGTIGPFKGANDMLDRFRTNDARPL